MSFSFKKTAVCAVALLGVTLSGCSGLSRRCEDCHCPEPPPPLGHIIDPIFQAQEANAEAADFAIPEHEFVDNVALLNPRGEEHIKNIAVRAANTPFPILIEPSSMSFRNPDEEPGTYEFPVHNNRELDAERRKVVVDALTVMGVADAEQRVVVAPLIEPGYEFFESQNAYFNGFQGGFGSFGRGFGVGGFGNGFGGGFGGLGGFGGFGGFGGGFGGFGGGFF